MVQLQIYSESMLIRFLYNMKNKPQEQKYVFLKSWNEWGEGNYMEPDLKYGLEYINVLSQELKNEK